MIFFFMNSPFKVDPEDYSDSEEEDDADEEDYAEARGRALARAALLGARVMDLGDLGTDTNLFKNLNQ